MGAPSAIAYNLAGLEITVVRDSGHRPETAGDNNIETGATLWRCAVTSTPVSIYEEEVRSTEAAKHVASARHLLTELRKKLERFEDFPELEEAITRLEMALNILTVKTGGML